MFELWDINIPSLPERSHLYPMKPIGIGTPYIESLTSYLMRLAEVHTVLPMSLVMSEILPRLGQSSQTKTSTVFSYNNFLSNARSLNGMDTLAERVVETLEKLTKCNNLRVLTMLPWVNVISKMGLIRETQAWCPLCYEEWRVHGNTIYNPLLWSLKVVKVCLLHRQILHECCLSPLCQKSIPMFAPKGRLGYCPYCNYWLGDTTATNFHYPDAMGEEETERALWNVIAIGEILEINQCLSSWLQKEDLSLAINRLVDRTPDKSVASLAHLIAMGPTIIRVWALQWGAPKLETLLQLCRSLGISPQYLFFEKSGNSILPISRAENAVHYKNLKKTRKLHSLEELQRSLEEVLASTEDSFHSLQEVAQHLGYRTKSQIYSYFPELAKAITEKYQKYRKPNGNQILSSDELRQALEAVLVNEKNPPPSIQEVASRLGYRNAKSLLYRFPELSKAIAVKYRQYFPYKREPMAADEIRQALEAVLANNDEPPPSLQEVALRLGYRSAGSASLGKRFPELSRAIAAKHRQHNLALKEPLSPEELQQALEAALASDDEPPLPLQEVALRLGYRSATPISNRYPELAHAITAKYQKYHYIPKKRIRHDEVRQALEAVLASNDEPPPSLQEVALRLGYRSKDSLYYKFSELSRKIVAKHRRYESLSKERIISNELRQALEMILASDEFPYPSIQEVALRLGYSSEKSLYKRFPDLAHTIAVKSRKQNLYKERIGSDELRQFLEAALANQSETPLSVLELSLHLGYQSERALYKRFPQLSKEITQRYQKYKFNRQLFMSSDELQEALEAALTSDEEPPPSIEEVAQRLGYRSSKFFYQRFPQLAHAISLRRRNSEGLRQDVERLLENADLNITQNEIIKSLGCSLKKLHQYFPDLPEVLKERRKQAFDFERLQLALEEELLSSEEEPRSLTQVANALGQSVSPLVRMFPSLCQKIVDRRKAYRKIRSELRKQKIEEEVRRVVLSILAEKQYPSLGQTLKLVDWSCIHRPIFYLEVYFSWSTILEDLGYRQ